MNQSSVTLPFTLSSDSICQGKEFNIDKNIIIIARHPSDAQKSLKLPAIFRGV
jgi:hypothetical protein